MGVGYIFISHDLCVFRHLTNRVAAPSLGQVIETGSTEDFFDRSLHPYTVALISASPKLDMLVQGSGQSYSQFPWLLALG